MSSNFFWITRESHVWKDESTMVLWVYPSSSNEDKTKKASSNRKFTFLWEGRDEKVLLNRSKTTGFG